MKDEEYQETHQRLRSELRQARSVLRDARTDIERATASLLFARAKDRYNRFMALPENVERRATEAAAIKQEEERLVFEAGYTCAVIDTAAILSDRFTAEESSAREKPFDRYLRLERDLNRYVIGE